jgi:hypothetical protein
MLLGGPVRLDLIFSLREMLEGRLIVAERAIRPKASSFGGCGGAGGARAAERTPPAAMLTNDRHAYKAKNWTDRETRKGPIYIMLCSERNL